MLDPGKIIFHMNPINSVVKPALLSMRRPVFLLIVLMRCAVPALWAQGSGVVEGRVVNGTDARIAAAGVDLDVIGLGGGMTVLKSAVTDPSGRFRIEGLPTGPPLMIRANYQSVNYHSRFSLDASGKASVEVEVFEATTSMKDIRVEGVRLGFQLDGDHLRAVETYSFVNETKPKKTFSSNRGSFRFTKPAGIAEPPRLSAQGPGAPMPLTQTPLESADGQSYYSLYALRPGTTTFELDYVLPYHDRTYTYRKNFYQDVDFFQIGVIPQDVAVTGEGLKRIQVDVAKNFAVYTGGPLKAGSEMAVTFAGGTPTAAGESSEGSAEPRIRPMPTSVGRYTPIVGPLLLMVFIVVLWYAYNNIPAKQPKDSRTRELRQKHEQLLQFVASLDQKYENKEMERREYHRLRAHAKSQLRRISLLLGKK
ncbi:MAG: hypothetical protein DMG08_01845 [Acidobacteria bacterium]|nr:MAG: hypothetical protein DMG08_01845 [Acidobacteriota bacterium]